MLGNLTGFTNKVTRYRPNYPLKDQVIFEQKLTWIDIDQSLVAIPRNSLIEVSDLQPFKVYNTNDDWLDTCIKYISFKALNKYT